MQRTGATPLLSLLLSKLSVPPQNSAVAVLANFYQKPNCTVDLQVNANTIYPTAKVPHTLWTSAAQALADSVVILKKSTATEAIQNSRPKRHPPYKPALIPIHSFTRLSLSALLITDTELKLIAAAAIIGESSTPKNGYSNPAATGTPNML